MSILGVDRQAVGVWNLSMEASVATWPEIRRVLENWSRLTGADPR